MPEMDPRVLALLILLSFGYYVGGRVVDGARKVERKAEHVVKEGGKKIGHVLKKIAAF